MNTDPIEKSVNADESKSEVKQHTDADISVVAETVETKTDETESKVVSNEDDSLHYTLSELELEDELYFSMTYQSCLIKKQGLLAKFTKKTEQLDIDLACALYNDNNELQEIIWYKKLRDSSESVLHYGDELHGMLPKKPQAILEENNSDKDTAEHTVGNDKKEKVKEKKQKYKYIPPPRRELETIQLNLAKLPAHITHVALFVSSFQNVAMNKVNGVIELKDIEGNSAMYVDFSSLPEKCSKLWLASLKRVTREDSTNNDSSNQESVRKAWQLQQKELALSANSIDLLAEKLFTLTA